MTVEEVKEKYIEMFGGFPYFSLMGASDEYIIQELTPCIESGKNYEPKDDFIY